MLSIRTNYASSDYASPNHLTEIAMAQGSSDPSPTDTIAANPLQSVIDEMQRRSTNLGYGLGVGLRPLFGTDSDNTKSLKKRQSTNVTEPFSDYYGKIFSQNTIRTLYIELDPGVDDGAALLQLLAATKNVGAKNVEIVGIAPCVGNAILPQTEQNTLQFLELTNNQNIKVYPGAIAPLAIENNQTAIEEMEEGINATHFYGHDGEADVGGWPNVTMKLQTTPGYLFAADAIADASPEAPLTLVSTSALTELSKTLTELVQRDRDSGKAPGSFAKNINAISIMGGCIDKTAPCNAPFNVPPSEKNSEANFYFDSLAAKNVFSICQQFQIPILLAPLDLTQQPGLLWTKEQVNVLRQMKNGVAQQWARVTNVVPYIDARNFPNGTYPMHDLQAATNFLFPEFYEVTRAEVVIGDVGQIIINPNATDSKKNVYILSMPPEKQKLFYQTVLSQFNNFNKTPFSFSVGALVGMVAAGVAFIGTAILGAFGLRNLVGAQENELPEVQKLI